jgi:hypothetical protein
MNEKAWGDHLPFVLIGVITAIIGTVIAVASFFGVTGKTILDIFRPTPKPPIVTPTPKPPVTASIDIRRPTEQEVRTMTNVWDLTQPTGCKFINTSTTQKNCTAHIDAFTDYAWGFSWCANTEAQLQNELKSLKVIYQIDKRILKSSEFTQFTELNDQNKICIRSRVVIKILDRTKIYPLKLSIELYKNIYADGQTYVKGRHTLNLNLSGN